MEENRNNVNTAGETLAERKEACKAVAEGIAKLLDDVKPNVSIVLMELESGDMVVVPQGSPLRLMVVIAETMRRNDGVRLLIEGASDMLKEMTSRDRDEEQ